MSSRGLEEILTGQDPAAIAAGARAAIERLRYAEVGHRGWLEVTLTHEQALAEWFYVDTVKEPDYHPLPAAAQRLRVLPGAGQRKLLPDASS